VYPLCRQRYGPGLNAGTNAFAPGELDEATRSTRILASPISPGTHNRAEVATLLGQHVLVLLRLRRESVSTAGWPRRDPSRLINGRRGRPSAALVQPSITRYSAPLKRLLHGASNVRTDECRLRAQREFHTAWVISGRRWIHPARWRDEPHSEFTPPPSPVICITPAGRAAPWRLAELACRDLR
jgi:hypothetical protein